MLNRYQKIILSWWTKKIQFFRILYNFTKRLKQNWRWMVSRINLSNKAQIWSFLVSQDISLNYQNNKSWKIYVWATFKLLINRNFRNIREHFKFRNIHLLVSTSSLTPSIMHRLSITPVPVTIHIIASRWASSMLYSNPK